LPFFALLALGSSSASAATIYQYGANGVDGTDGLAGDPGTAGTAGSDGEPVTADATQPNSDPDNTAWASGGAGGAGGRGGSGTDGSDPGLAAQGGAGGNGASGGAATAIASMNNPAGVATASATANGGHGGWGGYGGHSRTEQGGIGTPGAGGSGGRGGDATATATVEGTTQAYVTAVAIGGPGGNAGWPGDDDGSGGNAAATVTGTASDPSGYAYGTVTAESDSLAVVSGTLSAGNLAALDATVTGGSLSIGPLFAESLSGGQANVRLSANGRSPDGNGTDVILSDVIDAASGGQIFLSQSARGGDGARAFDAESPGLAGIAASSLSKNATNEWLAVSTTATGGNGGDSEDVSAAAGGSAMAAATANNTGQAYASASATGGKGGFSSGYLSADSGDGGIASLGTVFASSSTGGAVHVSGSITGGEGGPARYGGNGNGGDGADAALIDAVDGFTTGRLSLSQVAIGGRGGDAGDGMGGRAGDASSALSRSGGFEQLDVYNAAVGGAGSCGGAGSPGGSGSAYASSTSVNATGNAGADARATAGDACLGAPGTATVGSLASAPGDVRVTASASGGRGGDGVNGADGGSPILERIFGESIGGGAVDVFVNIVGGNGGRGSYGPGAVGGNGASVELTNAADGETTGKLALSQQAFAGDGGEGAIPGAAGDVTLWLSKSGAYDSLSLFLNAFAGDGGPTPHGGGASAPGGVSTLTAVGTAAGAVTIDAWANGGNGGYVRAFPGVGAGLRAGDGGTGVFGTVTGTSTGGGPVTVTGSIRGGSGGFAEGLADAGSGASVSMINAVDGLTSGMLSLSQHAVAGDAGSAVDGQAGDAGDATSHLTKTGSFSSLVLDVLAGAGAGACRRNATPNGGAGGNAHAQVVAVNLAGDAAAKVGAYGGWGGCGAGPAGETYVSASASGAGAASVSVYATGGRGGDGAYGSASQYGDGADGGAVAIGAVVGESTGAGPVNVSLDIEGGNGGDSAHGSASGNGGSGTSVILNNAVDGTTTGALSLRQTARGGDAGQVSSTSGLNGNAGEASSLVTKSGSFASLEVVTEAWSGWASRRSAGGALANGTNGTATSVAENLAGSARAMATARGGDGGYSYETRTHAPGGFGSASAVATGATTAEARAEATGGGYGYAMSNAGSADASATATGAGLQNLVVADSSAAGAGGRTASARAASHGGIVVAAAAHASASAGEDSTIGNVNEAGGRVLVGSASTPEEDPFTTEFGREAFAALQAMPDRAAVDGAISGNAAVQGALDPGGMALLLGQLGGANAPGDPDYWGFAVGESFSSTSFVSLTLDAGALSSGDNILLGLLDPVSEGFGFDSLRFRALGEGSMLIDETFLDAQLALAFFDDHPIRLASLAAGPDGLLDLRFELDFLSASAGDAFYFNFVAQASPVPLPGTAWLLPLAVGWLAPHLRRR
jgi:hypothetical protein